MTCNRPLNTQVRISRLPKDSLKFTTRTLQAENYDNWPDAFMLIKKIEDITVYTYKNGHPIRKRTVILTKTSDGKIIHLRSIETLNTSNNLIKPKS